MGFSDIPNRTADQPYRTDHVNSLREAGVELESDVSDHLADVAGAHAAAAISNVASGNLAATDVQAALDELQADIDTRATDSDLTTHTADTAAHGVTGSVVGTTSNQTLTNKSIGDSLVFSAISSPGAPGAGVRVYAKSDGKIYKHAVGGSEQEIGSGASGGGVNFLDPEDRDAEGNILNGWRAYDDSGASDPSKPEDGIGGISSGSATTSFTSMVRLELTSVAGEVLAGDYSYKLTKLSGNAQGYGVSIDFPLDLGYRAKRCEAKLQYKVTSGSIAYGDIKAFIIKDVELGGDYVVEQCGEISSISGDQGEAVFYFDPSLDYEDYRLCLHFATSSTDAVTIAFDEVRIQDKQSVVGDAVEEEFAYNTDTTTTAGHTADTGMANGEDGTALLAFASTTAGSTTQKRVRFSTAVTEEDQVCIEVKINNSWVNQGSTEFLYQAHGGSRYGIRLAPISGSTTDYYVSFGNMGALPNNGTYAGAGANWSSYTSYKWRVAKRRVRHNVTMAESAVEYVSNSDTTSAASNTSSFAYGQSGALVPNAAVGSTITRRVRFPTPVSNGERIAVETKQSGSGWIEGEFPWLAQGATARYGIRVIPVSGSTTDFDVQFAAQGSRAIGATYGSNGYAWSNDYTTGTMWRLVKSKNALAVGVDSVAVISNHTNERIERASVGSTGTITRQSGSWLTSVTKTGTGAYTLNIASGMFSEIPTVVVNAAGTNGILASITTRSATAFQIGLFVGTTATDGSFDVIAMGPK